MFMNNMKPYMNTFKSTVFGLFAVAFLVIAAPVAHAQWDSTDGFVGDGGGCCSYDSSPSYIDTYTPNYDYGTSYGSYSSPYSSYSTPSYYGGSSGYSTPSFYGGVSSGYATPSFYGGSTPSNTYAPTNTWDNGNTYTYAPSNMWDNGNTTSCTTPNSCSTYDNGNTSNSYNTTDSYNTTSNTCIYPGSCSVDDHSVVNANTTISSPTNITVTNPPASQTQIVYNNPAPVYTNPVYQTPTYYSNPTPVYQPTYQQPVYRNPSTPYITLSQVPYTGLELGPIGRVVYWSFLTLFSLFGAYLIVVKRAHVAVARGLKSALFGEADEHTQVAHKVAEQHAHEEVIETPAAANTDSTDEFILSQINRARA